MKYLARKISRAKWAPKYELAPNEISADALTSDLKTTGSKLSLWNSKNSIKKDIEDVALAISSKWQRIDPMDIVWVEKQIIEETGISLENTPGETPVKDLISLHWDAISLDLVRIVGLANCVADAIRNKEQYHRFSKTEVVKILKDAIGAKRMKAGELSTELQDALSEI